MVSPNIVKFLLPLTLLSLSTVSVNSIFINPANFLDVDLFQGTWLSRADVASMGHVNLFEGGWIWTETGNLLVTNVCRANRLNGVTPGELLNGTCYVSGKPELTALSGVREFDDWSVLLKLDDEVYEWVTFSREDGGQIPAGAVVGGIRPTFEPLLICRKVYNGTAGNVRASKAVLGNFSPKDGKCYYELEFGTDWLKFDLSFTSEHFQILVLRARGKPACPDRKSLDVDDDEDKDDNKEIKTSHYVGPKKLVWPAK